MSEHVHDWAPMMGLARRYRCAGCGASGYRAKNGVITAHSNQGTYANSPRKRPTARNVMPGGGRIPPKPGQS